MNAVPLAPRILIPFKAAEAVNTLKPLLEFNNFGPNVSTLLFALVNLSSTDQVHFFVETSEDGVHTDNERTYEIIVLPLKQGSLEIGPDLLRTWFRLSAQTDSPSFPTANIQWQVKGLLRRW